MRNNRKGALPDNRQGSPVLSARQHAAAAQPRPPRTVTYPSAEQAQPPQHLGIHIPHRPDASDHPTDAGHCLTSPPGPYAPTPRRNAPVPFKTLPCRRTPTPHRPDTSAPPPTPGHASPPGSNAPTPRRNAPAPFKAYPCRRTPAPHRSDASNHPADTGTRPAPSTTSPHRRSPMLQLTVATRAPHSRHTPAAAQRFHRPDASDNPADTGTRHAPGTASPHRRDPTLQHSAATRQRHSRHFPTAAQRPPHHPDASNHPADTGTRPAPGTKNLALGAGPIQLSVIFQ